MLDERTQLILSSAIREFIKTGEPVSSGHLYERYDFGIKPAMIRLILKDLDDAGYLEQPNYSAGRVPSDRGYEFFANYVLQDDRPAPAPAAHNLFASFEQHAWADMLGELSHELGLLSAITRIAANETYKTGLEALIDHLEWDSRAELTAVIRDFEALDERIGEAKEALAKQEDDEGDIRIFIGKKSPVTQCEHLSVVAGDYDVDGEHMMLFAIGPKRMDYQRAIKTFKNLKNASHSKK